MSIKIDWDQIKSLKTHLEREGYTPTSDVAIIVLFKNNIDSQRVKIKLGTLDRLLYDISDQPHVIGIYVFDAEFKKPLWRTKEELMQSLETVPGAGHANIVKDFSAMSEQQRNVWLELTVASIMQYTESETQ